MFGLFKKKDNNTPCQCFKEPYAVATIKYNVYSSDMFGFSERLEHQLRIVLYQCPVCGKRTYISTNDKYVVDGVKELLNKWLSRRISTQQVCTMLKYYE